MYCDACGKELTGDSTFCGFCGAAAGPEQAAPTAAAPNAAPAGPQGAQPGTHPLPVPYPQHGPSPQPPPAGSALPWVLGGLGLAAVVALVLVLVLVVFRGDGPEASGPEPVVRDFDVPPWYEHHVYPDDTGFVRPEVGVSANTSNCPKCQSRQIVEIVYGFPAPELVERAERGEVKLGGCLIEPGQPDWGCRECGYLWRTPE